MRHQRKPCNEDIKIWKLLTKKAQIGTEQGAQLSDKKWEESL
jgi:hypothetical protein